MQHRINVLELRSVRGTGGGPDKTIMMGAARTDPTRFRVTVCYIRDRRDGVFGLDRLARRLGLDYVEIVERHSFDRQIWPALRRLVRDRSIDIVHAHDYKTDALAWLLARTERLGLVSTVHGWSGWSLRERLLYYPADRQLLRAFPRIIAVSHTLKADLLRAGVDPDRVSVILNGIDVKAFRRDPGRVAAARAAFGLRQSAQYVAAVGRLEREKRYDVLIDAVALLRRVADVGLLIAGTGSLEAELRKHADRRGVSDACVFAGQVTDVRDVFHAADVFVQSSDNEGAPNAVLEAMALEVPVVATDVGGTGDLVSNGVHALLVPRRDPERLASTIHHTIRHRSAALQRVAAARRRIEDELSFDARMRALESVYERLIASHRRVAEVRVA